MSAPKGNKNASGPHRRHVFLHRPAGAANRARSATITAMVVQLHDERGLSFDQISIRMALDFDYRISRAAVWQRYKRGKRNGS